MSDILKVAVLQLDIASGDKTRNISEASRLIESLPEGYDIAVLPEMFTTGFICDPSQSALLAESVDGATMTAMRSLSARHKIAICGSFIARDGDAVYNRAFFVEPSGDTYFYDKHHLFSFSGEDIAYRRGASHMPVFRFRGWNIAMAVCFDLRFPAWLRNHDGAYDLLIIMANWPDSRAYPWKQLLIARAIENQSYVIGCNRSGTDIYGEYAGISIIIDAKGKILGEKPGEPVISADLSKESLDSFRTKFPVLPEADRFTFTIE